MAEHTASSVEDARRGSSDRSALLALAREYMTRDLGLAVDEVDARCDRLAPAQVAPVEFAHTPQFPHAGVVRLLLQAQRLAHDQGGTFLYFVNDHLPAAALPESRYIPLTTDDGPVAKPPRFGPGKKSGKGGMHRLPAPDQQTIDALSRRLTELLPGSPSAAPVASVLATASAATTSLAAWLVRAQTDLLHLRPVIVPTSGLTRALPGRSATYFRARPDGRWTVCEHCGYRAQHESGQSDTCSNCGSPEPPGAVPDVVGRQFLGNLFGLRWRVCGAVKPYQELADRTSEELLGRPAPRRWHITGRSQVRRGQQLVQRANLIQMLIEGPQVADLRPPNEGSKDWELTL